jgi:arylsulfatase A-like enzyme
VVPSQGSAVDGAAIARCVRPALEAIATDVAPSPLRPNLLVIMTDDQRWDTLQYMPHVESDLVNRGIEFRQSFVTTSLCCPSRSSFYSGEYAHHTGVLGNGPPNGGATRFDASSALPVWLSNVGYRTALLGKYMNSNFRLAPAVPPGWDVWQTFVQDGGSDNSPAVYYDYTLNENGTLVNYGESESDYSTDLLRRRSLAFIRDSVNGPFFLVFAPFAPHDPAVPATRHRGRFAGLPPWRPPNWAEKDVSGKPDWVKFMAAITTAEGLQGTDTLRIDMLESLLAVDEAVDAIDSTLEDLGLSDDTVVIFTSDNGFHWREHWWMFKQASYEESIRVPLVLRYPALAPLPSKRDELVLNIDLAPTLAELGGASLPPSIDGASLIDLLAGSVVWRQDFLEENWGGVIISPNFSVRNDRWVYIDTWASHGITEELYDLANDPYELDNLAIDGQHGDLVAQMSARLAELQSR